MQNGDEAAPKNSSSAQPPPHPLSTRNPFQQGLTKVLSSETGHDLCSASDDNCMSSRKPHNPELTFVFLTNEHFFSALVSLASEKSTNFMFIYLKKEGDQFTKPRTISLELIQA